MTITLCLLLALAAFYFAWRRRAVAAARSLAALILILVSVGCGVVPLLLLPLTQSTTAPSDSSWAPHDTIVLLGAGTLPREGAQGSQVPVFGFGRVLTAAQAYFACRTQSSDCKVLASGGDPQRHGETEASVYAKALMRARVPREDIIIEDKSNNTWQNASNSTRLVSSGRVLHVVTSAFQLKRSLLYFSHFRPDVRGIAADKLAVELSPFPSTSSPRTRCCSSRSASRATTSTARWA